LHDPRRSIRGAYGLAREPLKDLVEAFRADVERNQSAALAHVKEAGDLGETDAALPERPNEPE
jgi:hypothetical protein